MELAVPLAPEVPYSYSNTQREAAAEIRRGTGNLYRPAKQPGRYNAAPGRFGTPECPIPTVGRVRVCKHD